MNSDNRLSEYLFWKHQYVARNPYYLELKSREQEIVDDFFQATPKDQDSYWIEALPGIFESDISQDSHSYPISERQQELIQAGRDIHGRIKQKFPFVEALDIDHNTILQACISGSFSSLLERNYFKVCRDFVTPIDSPSGDPEIFDIRINVHGNIEQILEGVRTWYCLKKCELLGLHDKVMVQDSEVMKLFPYRHSESAILDSFKEEVSQIPTNNFFHNARAVGLWLWEEIKESGSSNVAAQIRRLKQVKNFERLGYASSEPDVFRRQKKKTESCIEAGEVLPLS